MAVFIGDYVIHRNKLEEFKALTAKVVEAHQGNLEKFLDYLQDTSQILETKEVLEIVNRNSDRVSSVEAILVQELIGHFTVGLVRNRTYRFWRVKACLVDYFAVE